MADKTMKFEITAKDNASRTFAQVGASLDRLSGKLDELGRKEVKPRVTADTERSKTRVDELAAALRELKNQRLRVDVDMGPGRTAVGDLRRELSYLRNVKVKVDLTVPPAAQVARLRQLRDAVADLDGRNAAVTVGVVGQLPDAGELRRAARALKDLRDVRDIAIHITITGAVEALAQVAALRRELRGLPNDTTVKVKAEADSDPILRAARSLLTLRGAALLAGPALLGSTVPAVATLAGSLTSLAGLAPIAVGALAGLGAVAGTMAVGFAHVNDALGPTGTPAQLKKVDAALAQLSPNAREAVGAIRSFAPAWTSLRLDVQQKLFAGVGAEIKTLGGTYLPILRSGMGGVATQLNGLAKDFVGFATQANTTRDVGTIFENTRDAVEAARPGVINLAAAFRDVAVVGTGMLPGLATGWTNATGRFREFIAQARESGQLQQWIQGGVDTLKTLGSVAGNVGSSLYSVFTAAKASGADFLSTLDKVTGKLADLLASDTGQSALTAFFKESRAAVDALMPGVEALAVGVLQMVQSFSNTGAISNMAQTLSQLAQTVAPLGSAIGSIAGGALNALTNAAQIVYGAAAPLVGLFVSMASGASGVIGPVLAAVVAFKALGSAAIAGSFATLAGRLTALAPAIGTYTAGLTGSLAAGNAAQGATTRLGSAVGKLGNALPLIGVALIGLGALYDQFSSKADEAAGRVLQGSQSMQAAIAGEAEQIHKNQVEWLGGMNAQESYAAASKNVTDEVNKQRAALGPMAQLQSDVSRAQADLNDAVAQFSADSPQATAAAGTLAAATGKLKTAQDGAATAARSHEEAVAALADEMNSQINSALGYASAVQRTAEAQKAANDALKNSGAKSDEYKAAVLSLAQAMSSQADAARKQAEALGGAEAGASAYNTEILRSADLSTKAGRDAFTQLAAGLDSAGLAAISSAAKLSGLRTEIVTLPDGRKVTVVVEADRAKLDSVKQGVEDLASKKYIGTVTILATADGAKNSIIQTVQLADGSKGTIKVNADGSPALLSVGQTKYTIDSTTGQIKVLGDVAPGEASLAGFKLVVDQTTGQVKLVAEAGQAEVTLAAWKALADSVTGVPQLNSNPAAANAVLQLWKSTSDATTGLPNIDAKSGKAEGVLAAWKALANGTTGIPALDSNPGLAQAVLAAWKARSDGTTGLPKLTAVPNVSAAEAALNNAARDRQSTVYQKVVTSAGSGVGGYVGTGSGTRAIATGAILRPMAEGGIVGYAGGGIRRLTPMRGDVAARVPANTWRVIGDRMRGMEYYLPDDDKPATMAIGAEWARRRGLTLASIMEGRAGAAQTSPAVPSTASGLSRRIGPATATSSGPVMTQLDDSRVVAELQSLRVALAGVGASGHDARLADAVRQSGLSIEAAVARLAQSSAAGSARSAFVASESGAW